MSKIITMAIFTITLLIVFGGCTTTKYLAVIDGSKSDGTLTMGYEYGIFEQPDVQWDAAKRLAISKCQSWGYKGAEFFGTGQVECISRNYKGDCLRYRVIYKCQCTD